jgi:hypothetical protein
MGLSFAAAGTPSVMNDFELVDSDIELLRAARSDPDAFGDLSRRHAVALERWIRARAGRPGTWVLIMCTAGNPSNTGSGDTGNTGAGNTSAG